MADKNRTIILIQLLTNPQSYDFDTQIETMLTSSGGAKDNLLCLDNFSEPSTIHYARALIAQSDKIVVICYFQDMEATPGHTLGLLNQLLKHPSPSLLSNSPHPSIQPLMIRLGGRYFETVESLRKILFE